MKIEDQTVKLSDYRRASRVAVRGWRTWHWVLGLGAGLAGIVAAATFAVVDVPWARFAVLFVGYYLISFASLRLIRSSLQTRIRHELNQAGYRLCLSCGYDLREIQSDVCPECGAAVKAVGTTDATPGGE